MKDYIRVSEVDNNIDFVNFAISTKNVDSKSKIDMNKLCEEAGFNFDKLTSNVQIHSSIVNIVDKENINKKHDGDALVTNLRQVPLLIFTADCVPIAIIDKKNKAIGLAHAGWRGTFEEIGKKTIELMMSTYNTNPDDVVCIIGPSIGPCCYEVSEELVEKFNTNLTKNRNKFNINLTNEDEKFYIIKEGKYHLDLWKINEYVLKAAGVKDENIINLKICTSCEEDKFHSYRKHNQTGKRIGMILEIK